MGISPGGKIRSRVRNWLRGVLDPIRDFQGLLPPAGFRKEGREHLAKLVLFLGEEALLAVVQTFQIRPAGGRGGRRPAGSTRPGGGTPRPR